MIRRAGLEAQTQVKVFGIVRLTECIQPQAVIAPVFGLLYQVGEQAASYALTAKGRHNINTTDFCPFGIQWPEQGAAYGGVIFLHGGKPALPLFLSLLHRVGGGQILQLCPQFIAAAVHGVYLLQKRQIRL